MDLRFTRKVPVEKEAGEKMATEIDAYAYRECSAKKNEGIQEVFDAAVRAIYLAKWRPKVV